MCGIFGFTGPRDDELASRALALLAHRGPDAAATVCDGELTLGATRLAIVGVANGRQPLASEDGEIVAVVNGEIYNHAALRDELERRGHRFATDTDSEVVVHLYEEAGEALVERLDGIFAFALWDRRARRLVLARDPLGVKPLFWTEQAGRFRFASEVKALLADPAVARRLDRASLDAQLALGFVPAERTLFEGIRRVLPGHLLVRDAAGQTTAAYWRPEVRAEGDESDPVAGFRTRFERAVESQLAHEVPMGFALSGGIDSSLVVAVARRIVGAPIRTYAIGGAGSNDERPWAELVARHCRTEHTAIDIAPGELRTRLPAALWHLEDVRGGPVVAHYALFERVARAERVLLVGEGADELLGGYPRLKPACGIGAWLPPPLARRAYLLQSPHGLGRKRIYSDDFLAGLVRPAPERRLDAVFSRYGGARRERLLAFEQERLGASHLALVDRMSMAHAVEARVPFLDRELVAYVNRLPMSWKLRARAEKRLLREAARGLLPESVRTRPKFGHRDPLWLWPASGLDALADELLSPAAVAARGLWRPAHVERLRARSRRGGGLGVARLQLQRMIQVELWQRLFEDPRRIEAPTGVAAPAA